VADIADRAEEREQRDREAGIAKARELAARTPPRVKDCWNECGAKTEDGARWCSAACRDDYVKRTRSQG
jgi:hypothetical protein